MPVGIVSDVLCILVGGFLGTVAGKRLPDKIKESLPMAFSLAAMAMGITSTVKYRFRRRKWINIGFMQYYMKTSGRLL